YESGDPSTVLFFVITQIIQLLIAWLIGFLIVNDFSEYIDDTLYYGVIVAIGTTFYLLVYRQNLIVLAQLKRGPVINRYSVLKIYQIRENITIFRVITSIAQRLIFACMPPFIFYPIYKLVPPNIGYDGLRLVSVSMYDCLLTM
ncbi:hypothetical protein PFISCL1PPCAC_14091, partial [Pristionchus fissidentatus]